jgi:oligopeptide/dipeptide ABC transporter ATP-binding protein
MAALLEAQSLTKIFGSGTLARRRNVALADFSFAVAESPPSITAIVGESGSGKTTLARLLLGLIEPSAGAVRYRGTDLRALSGAERRAFRRDVQVVFQDPYEAYNPFYRIDHVLWTPLANFGLAKSREAGRQMIADTLRKVGLRPEETLGRYPHQLSGGQRQRVMVARALLIRPRLIIADEPVSMVDASLRATILGSLRQLHEAFGISLIYVTHDLTTAYQISHDVIVLYRGLVAEAGGADFVVRRPAHPYTQLLVGSIPQPDPDRPWHGALGAGTDDDAGERVGCRFASRCPHVMDLCRTALPPLFRVEPARAAACNLYRDAPPLGGDRIGEVLSASAAPASRAPIPGA